MIELSNNYYIRKDTYGYVLVKRVTTKKDGDKKPKNDTYDVSLSYHMTLETLLKAYLNELIKNGIVDGVHTTLALLDILKSLEDKLKEIQNGIETKISHRDAGDAESIG